jgi:uracil phosphoribosyltransferase
MHNTRGCPPHPGQGGQMGTDARTTDTHEIDESRLVVVDHPLVQHKLSILRDETTPTAQFRQLVRELAAILAYEATRDLPLEDCQVTTPLETMTGRRIAGKKLAVVPILRAGIGMMDGVLDLIPAAHVGVLGMSRDEETFRPVEYYKNLPPRIGERICLLVDPMLATGGSICDALGSLRAAGADDVRVLTLVSAPEGLAAVQAFDPRVRIFTCAVDRGLNEHAYILPGLGDAGDRIFGTVER